MATLAGTVMGIVAACSFNADPVAPAFFTQRGFANGGFLRNGAGDYTLTFQDGVNAQTEALVMQGLSGAAAGMMAVEFLTTTTVRVRILNSAAVAADTDFWLSVQKLGAN